MSEEKAREIIKAWVRDETSGRKLLHNDAETALVGLIAAALRAAEAERATLRADAKLFAEHWSRCPYREIPGDRYEEAAQRVMYGHM